jgi:ribosomal protein L11 methyltransferase
MKNYLRISIETPSVEAAEIVMAQLSEIDFYAFETEGNFLFAYIREADFNPQRLEEQLPSGTVYETQIIADQNWNQQWENGFQPVKIDDFVAIRAGFHQPVTDVRFEVIITPKMSFGTGHHATTFLMIDLMERIHFKNKTVIDFGAGTGVLAILAEKMGATQIFAVDNDEWSMKNLSENVKANNCTNIICRQQSDLENLPSADIIFANINLNVLIAHSSMISSLLRRNGRFLCSGFLQQDESKIIAQFVNKKLVKKEIRQRNGWSAIMFVKG